MKHFSDCIARSTGLSAPHSLSICGRWIHIANGDRESVLKYYTGECHMRQTATASDQNCKMYTIYTDTDDILTACYCAAIPEASKKGE